ncbi:NAD(P)-dependent oxidoreductase [Leptolyngbya sp. FACHB-261]|uniref:NAD(P)-dependent oxidoreductase n=1 Tax=Leptolyngbya sp. FACHB-261 TaxID=2692806 RepID=UPI001685E882|nr:NAD(P)-dependent oxidoreductase [Leptolyngbya sp. FACHB-261]MBD2104442.1 NAD(P)-dependent oxidoreductase [Leptolyngbya sp. FACHB-261]
MKLGWLGTGLMGLPMAQRLVAAGLPLVAYNRTAAKLEPLRLAGAEIATQPQAVLANADCIMLMLTNAQAIRDTLLNEQIRSQLQGRTIIQMGTIAPTESKDLCAQIQAAGGDYFEAPVLGSIPEAQTGKLIVMVGATPEQFERYQELLQHFGPQPQLLGPVGSASAIKLALNQLIASLTTAFSLSLGFVLRQEADVEAFMSILRGSALYAPTFDKKLQRMLDRNYDQPNFPTQHLLKDVNLFLAEAQAVEQNTSSLEGVRTILEIALEQGLTHADYSALFSAVNPSPE